MAILIQPANFEIKQLYLAFTHEDKKSSTSCMEWALLRTVGGDDGKQTAKARGENMFSSRAQSITSTIGRA
ncbi:hypothetical protein JHK87_055613 [Glycine soja]|nr:hypothetical protein JHK87_055613 [Glycine soja]